MRELMIEAEYAPFAPDWFLKTASRWFTVQKTPCLQTAEAVIGEPALEALQNAPRLRWLQMTWAGADRYLHGGFPRSVLLTTASGAFGETIAEHAIGMLLALCRRLPAYARQGNWNDLGSERRVAGGTALIFGAGDLGGSIARRLQAFGVKTVLSVLSGWTRQRPCCLRRTLSWARCRSRRRRPGGSARSALLCFRRTPSL